MPTNRTSGSASPNRHLRNHLLDVQALDPKQTGQGPAKTHGKSRGETRAVSPKRRRTRVVDARSFARLDRPLALSGSDGDKLGVRDRASKMAQARPSRCT